MKALWQRPLLVGGLSLSMSIWLLEVVNSSFHSAMGDMGSLLIWGAVALGSGVWWLTQQQSAQAVTFTKPVDRSRVEKALAVVSTRIDQLATEAGDSEAVQKLRQQLSELLPNADRKTIELSVMGGKETGKTTLAQLLKSGLSQSGLSQSALSAESAPSELEGSTGDVVLFLTTGDITDPDFQTIDKLLKQHHRVVLLFNKQDQYAPSDRAVVLQQLRDRMQDIIPPEDVLAISTQPALVKVRQQQADGTLVERMEQPAADLTSLKTRLGEILTTELQPILLGTVLRQAEALNGQVQQTLNQLRRQRSLPVIEQYQWIAGAATFANPVATLDVLATATITAQMVMDLGAIYKQSFSLDQAKAVASQLASQMVKLGLVELASQAIAPLLKSHALTYVAGGTLQGLSAAYLTRIAGLSLVEYFEERSQLLETNADAPFQVDRLVQKVKAIFQANQRSVFVQDLVKQGLGKLVPSTPAPAQS